MKHFIFLFLFVLMTPLNVMASTPLKVKYSLYASGFNVVDIDGVYTITDKNYDLKMNLKTAGLLGKLAPWSGIIETKGLNKATQSSPHHHQFASTWRGETETTTFTFDANGKLIGHHRKEDNGKIVDKMPPKDVYKDNPIDMLSALFRTMTNKTCETTQAVLDGKRRFDMAFRSKGFDMMEKSKYSVFAGEAEICDVEIIPVAGKWREKPRGWMSIQGQAKENGQLPRLWFGKVRDDMPPIPVRFLIKTNYGTMVMHLKGIEN